MSVRRRKIRTLLRIGAPGGCAWEVGEKVQVPC
jgi:hypothetical protein